MGAQDEDGDWEPNYFLLVLQAAQGDAIPNARALVADENLVAGSRAAAVLAQGGWQSAQGDAFSAELLERCRTILPAFDEALENLSEEIGAEKLNSDLDESTGQYRVPAGHPHGEPYRRDFEAGTSDGVEVYSPGPGYGLESLSQVENSSGSITISHPLLDIAIADLTALTENVLAARHDARAAVPASVDLPSLGARPLGEQVSWISSHLPVLEEIRDIARVLDTRGGLLQLAGLGWGTMAFTMGDGGIEDLYERVGEQLAKDAGELLSVGEDAEAASFADELEKWTGNEIVMATMFTELGPEFTLRVPDAFAAVIGDQTRPSTGSLRALNAWAEGFETATFADGFDNKHFADEFVRFMTTESKDAQGAFRLDRHLNGGLFFDPAMAAAFLTHGRTLHRDFLEPYVIGLDEFERIQIGPTNRSIWSPGMTGRHYPGLTPDGVDDGFEATSNQSFDPMASAMTALANDPELALDFFTADATHAGAPSQPDFYFSDRDWTPDGYHGISDVVAALATHDWNDLTDRRAVDGVVVDFVDGIAGHDSFNGLDALAASSHVAEIKGVYIDSVLATLGERARSSTELRTFDRPPYGRFDGILFDRASLDRLGSVAGAAPEGVDIMDRAFTDLANHHLQSLPTDLVARSNGIQRVLADNDRWTAYTSLLPYDHVYRVAQAQDEHDTRFTAPLGWLVDNAPVPGKGVVRDAGGPIAGFVYENTVTELAGREFDELFPDGDENRASALSSTLDDGERVADAAAIRGYQLLIENGVIDPSDIAGDFLTSQGNPARIRIDGLTAAERSRLADAASETLAGQPFNREDGDAEAAFESYVQRLVTSIDRSAE